MGGGDDLIGLGGIKGR